MPTVNLLRGQGAFSYAVFPKPVGPLSSPFTERLTGKCLVDAILETDDIQWRIMKYETWNRLLRLYNLSSLDLNLWTLKLREIKGLVTVIQLLVEDPGLEPGSDDSLTGSPTPLLPPMLINMGSRRGS